MQCSQLVSMSTIDALDIKKDLKYVVMVILTSEQSQIMIDKRKCAEILLSLIEIDWAFYPICAHWFINICIHGEWHIASLISESLLSIVVQQKNNEMVVMLCNASWMRYSLSFYSSDSSDAFVHNKRLWTLI